MESAMQRLTKYRLLVCTFALATVALATSSVLLQRSATQLREDATAAQKRAADSDKKVAERDVTIDRLKHDAATGGTAQTNLRVAIGAFARQAEVCEAVKQKLNIKE